jgi:hypothetical protein
VAKKAATRLERDHMGRVAELGCLICRRPAHVHHVYGLKFGVKSNWRVAPLCPEHHLQGAFGHCVHNGIETFEANYMTEAKMLEMVNKELGL